jgi:lysophospholipase L1-like esterase
MAVRHLDAAPPPSPDAPPPVRGAKLVLFALVPWIVIALVCELGAWAYFRLTQPYPTLEAYLTQRAANEFDPYRIIRLNPKHRFGGTMHDAQGFRRSTDVVKAKPPGTIRIFLMGGSAAYGVAPPPPFPPFTVTNEDTLDAHLERLLAARFPGRRIEVINAAVVGYRVHIHWIYLNQVLLDYDPDIVLFMDGHNDHYRASDAYNQFDYDHLALERLNEPSLRSALNAMLRFAAEHSYAAAGLQSRLGRFLDASLTSRRLEAPWAEDMERRDDQLLEVYRRTARRTWASIVRQNARLLQDRGVKAVVMLQPELLLAQSKPMTAEEEQLRTLERDLRPPGHEAYLNFVKPTTVALLHEALAGTDATFVDGTDPFGGVREQAYIDYCHLSGAGFAALARYLMPVLTPIVADVDRARSGGEVARKGSDGVERAPVEADIVPPAAVTP